jgi:hypothetical protein
MTELVLVGISGKIASGKDYLTTKLTNELDERKLSHGQTAFAYPLKKECDQIINMIRIRPQLQDFELAVIIAQLMKFEVEDGLRLVSILRPEILTNPDVTAYNRTVAVRSALQILGTEIRRRQNPSYWTDKFLRAAELSRKDVFFASDGRFPNEMDAVVDNYGTAFRLDIPEEVLKQRRESRDSVTYTPEQLNHVSETALDDYPKFDIRVGVQFNAADLVDQMLTISAQKR